MLRLRFYGFLAAMALSPLLQGNTAFPPVRYTGAPTDGGKTCSSCHSTYVLPGSDPLPDAGGITIFAPSTYVPGQQYLVQVEVFHSTATRWGFELTARIQNNETLQAGTFTPNSDVQVRCSDTQVGPCNGAVEFANHVAASTHPGQSVGNTWTMLWTAPKGDVGAVVFYAAGIAANNNNSPEGDRVYSTQFRSTSQINCAAALQPKLLLVVNAASNVPGPVAPNSLISVYGTGLAAPSTSRIAGAGDLAGTSFPQSLACVALEVPGGPRIPLTFVSPTQINAQLPNLPAGTASLRLVVNPGIATGQDSDPISLTVLNAAPAFFVLGTSKSIAALNPDGTYLADPALVPGGVPAQPGGVAVLFGTGFGPTSPPSLPGEIADAAATITATPSVVIGGIAIAPQDILYAGLSPGSIDGLYQLNVRVPAAIPDGNAPVVITIGGVSSQTGAYIPVKSR